MSNKRTANNTLYFSMAGNTCIALIKGIAGLLGNSFALIADAIESITDVFTTAFILLGFKYANKPSDANHPYGHGKIEPIISFFVALFLFCTAIYIGYHSIQNIKTPHGSPEAWTLYVLAGIIIWKESAFRFIHKKSKETKSNVLNAEAWHYRSDAITSVAAFIGISIALIFEEHCSNADDWAALIAVFIILYNCYQIFRPALGELMDEQSYPELKNQIISISDNMQEIIAIEKCWIRKVGMKYHIDIHAQVQNDISVEEGHQIAHMLEDKLIQEIPCIKNVLIHIEPYR